jgi:hypothetical protein
MLMDVLILMVYDKCPVDVSRLTWYGFDVLRSTMYGLYAVLVLIQHNAVSYRHPALHAYTHRAFFASKERPKTFDVIHSISTFDHDGLGRYGDPLDPDGDLRSMKEAHKNSAAGGGGVMILAVMILAVIGGTHRTGRGCMECTPCARPRSSPPPPPGLENGVQVGPSSGGARPASREPATAVANPDSTQTIRGAGWSRGGQEWGVMSEFRVQGQELCGLVL